MAEITPPKDLYYNLIPKEIKSKAFQKIPYPEILDKCEEFCNSEEFWMRKAANDTGNEYTQKFKDFFIRINKGTSALPDKYLRVLAYNNVAVPGNSEVPGSENFMAPSQMLKIGVDNNDKTLIYWALKKFNRFDERMFDYSLELKPLADRNMFEELLYIAPKLPGLYANFPWARWFLESEETRKYSNRLGEVLKDKNFEELYNFKGSHDLYKAFLEGNPEGYIDDPAYFEFYYMAKKYGYNNLPRPNIDTFIASGDSGIVYYAMLNAGYIDEAFNIFRENVDFDGVLSFVVYIGYNDDIKLDSKVRQLLSSYPELLAEYIISICFVSYNGSKVFERAFGELREGFNINDPRELLSKSLYDFEGLYRISRLIPDKERIIALSRYEVNLYEPTLFEIFGRSN